MENLHPKAVWLFFFRFLGVGMIIVVILSFFWGIYLIQLFLKTVWPYILAVFLVLITYMGFCYAWAKLTYKAYKYQLSEDAFKKEHGVIWKRYVSIPYERIQNVDIYRGILARVLGLSDFMIQTAGYAGFTRRGGIGGREPEGKLPGVSKERAEQLREELIRRAKGAKSGV